ncbi:hypothetical protein FRC02_008838 [Tulasnella sp. 418]|nr:hypothetical protein FRC02_008838 [Tulasnella sp. 418]
MRDVVIHHHPEFFSSLLPLLPEESDFSVSCLKSLPWDCWDRNSHQFTFTLLERDRNQDQALLKTLNAIARFDPEDTGNTPDASDFEAIRHTAIPSVRVELEFVRTDVHFGKRNLSQDEECGRYAIVRPCIAMVVKSARASWYDVALLIEMTGCLGADAIELARPQVEAMFLKAPTKRFIFSFILSNSWLKICLWDRAGTITSEHFDINESPHRFIEVIRRFTSMSPLELGFDETTIDIPEGIDPPVRKGTIASPIVAVNKETYYRLGVVACSSTRTGKSTRCFKATKLIKKDGVYVWSKKIYLIKYFWSSMHHQYDEGEIYERIKEAGVETGVANCQGFLRLSKLSDIRNGLPVAFYPFETAAEDDGSMSGSNIYPSEKVLVQNGRAEHFGDRQLCVMVLSTIGSSIGRAHTVYKMISGVVAALKGHKEIYEKAGILHRDISISNIRIRDFAEPFGDCQDEGEPRDPASDEAGFLVDFDLSLIMDETRETLIQRLMPAGTSVFMAWQILKQGPHDANDESSSSALHDFKHDLQSFFWVLLFICAGTPIFRQRGYLDYRHPSSKTVAVFANFPTSAAASAYKYGYLMDKDHPVWVAPAFTAMAGPLRELRDLLRPTEEKWDALTHDAFISVLERALQDPAVYMEELITIRRFNPVIRERPCPLWGLDPPVLIRRRPEEPNGAARNGGSGPPALQNRDIEKTAQYLAIRAMLQHFCSQHGIPTRQNGGGTVG